MESERAESLRQGLTAYEQRSWGEAQRSLSRADEIDPLAPEDLELLSTASYMVGDVRGMIGSLERAHRSYLERDRVLPAARTAIWLASNLAARGKLAEASGWVERARRLLDPVDQDCVEKGYLLLPEALRQVISGEMDQVVALAGRGAEIGRQFGDADLVALATQTQARAMLHIGETSEAFHLLDELMISVLGGECSPMVTGLVYCSVIEGCYEVHEVRRAGEWTDSLSQWCGSQPDLVAFTDQCLAHRAEILRLHGIWEQAMAEAKRSDRAKGLVAAQASYQQAEIHRMLGEWDQAENAYQQVALHGGQPQPGWARLRLAQGNEDAAVASIRRSVSETTDLLERVSLLPGFVDIMVDTGHVEEAAAAAAELESIAETTSIEMHRAWAKYAAGTVRLAEGSPVEAVPPLRSAVASWGDLEIPFELARARLALGRALLAAGDGDGSAVQFRAARDAFVDLGAAPHAEAARKLLAADEDRIPYGLTAREAEVLTHLASGATNRSIAESLILSERTVDRHVSNIFTKLGVNTRAAAAAIAVRIGLA